jgi:hypothetical protein
MSRWAAVPLVLLLAACGSTVQVTGAGREADPGSGLGDPGLGQPVAGALQPAAPAPVPTTTTSAADPGTRPVTGVGEAGGVGHPGSTVLASGPGYSAKEIRVGFSTSNDAGKALSSVGLGVAIADQEDLVKTWVAKVNADGGIAGRTVVPVFYDYKATGDVNTSDQAACETWTRDSRVFAATGVRAGVSGSGDVLTPCLARAGIAWLNAEGDQHQFDAYLPSAYNPSSMNRTRELQVLVEALAHQGFFTPGAKVGVIVSDNTANMSRAVKEGMEPALRRFGLSITKRVVIANAFTESTNAELQMFAAGVTHVLFAAPGGAAASQFMNAADSQRRTYQYGISTQDAPGAAVQALAPSSQLKNAHGYGYRPSLDVDASNQPPESSAMKACFGYYRSKGFDTGGLNRAAMALICDSFALLRAGVQGQLNPTLSGLATSVAGLGRRLAVAGTFSTRFTSRQHDGPGSYRVLEYGTDCSCFRYTGPAREV